MRLRQEIEALLRETGLPWSVELGTRHFKIKLDGQLVGIMPKGAGSSADKRPWFNLRAQIRRAAKEQSCQSLSRTARSAA